MSWHCETCGNQGWVFPLFSPDSNDRLSLNFHRFVILCDTRSVGLGQYCLPKVSNGFNWLSTLLIHLPRRENLTFLLSVFVLIKQNMHTWSSIKTWICFSKLYFFPKKFKFGFHRSLLIWYHTCKKRFWEWFILMIFVNLLGNTAYPLPYPHNC